MIPVLIDEAHQRNVDQHEDGHGDELLAGTKHQILQFCVDHPHIRQLADDGSQDAFQASVRLTGHHGIAPFPPDLVVDGGFQVSERRIHIRVDVLDAHQEALEHLLHRRVQVTDILLHGLLEVFGTQIGCGNDGQRCFQFCRHILFEAACCELDIPKRGQHQTDSQHRHEESVSRGNGDAGAQCKAEQRCKAHHGELVCPPGGCQDRLRLGDLTAEEPRLFSSGRLVDIGTDAAWSCGQTGKETVAQFPRRDMQHHKKPRYHADAGDQLDHSHSSSSFP